MNGLEVFASRLRGRREDLLSELNEIDAALRRIDAGSYGLCACCGLPIDPARLSLLPATSRCRACKRAYELRRGIGSTENSAD